MHSCTTPHSLAFSMLIFDFVYSFDDIQNCSTGLGKVLFSDTKTLALGTL